MVAELVSTWLILDVSPHIPLSDYVSQIMIEIGFNKRWEIIWNKAASASPSTAWGSWQSAANPILRYS